QRRLPCRAAFPAHFQSFPLGAFDFAALSAQRTEPSVEACDVPRTPVHKLSWCRRVGIYLPIAEISVNMVVLLAMGGAVGFLSGMFGVGGGFLITPLLIFYYVPPAIAVATGANQVIASSFSGALAHFRRGSLDVKLGLMLLAGGVVGSSAGIYVFAFLRRLGQLDLIVSLLY